MIKLYNAKDKIIFFLLSFFTILALNINLSAKGISADIIDETFGWAGGVLTLLASFNNYHIFYLILLPFLYYLYIFSYEQSKITQFNKWERNCVALPSVLFAFFMIIAGS